MNDQERLISMADVLLVERDELVRILNPMPAHTVRTHQLESALKAIDTAAGLLRVAAPPS